MSLSSHNIEKYLKTNQYFHKKLEILSAKNNDKYYRSSTNSFSSHPFSYLEYSRNIKIHKNKSLSKMHKKQKPIIKKFFLTLSKFDNTNSKEAFMNKFTNLYFPLFTPPKSIANNDIKDIYVNNIMASCCNIVKLNPPKDKKLKQKLPYFDENKKYKLKNKYISKIFKNKMIKKNFASLSNEKLNFNDNCFHKNNEVFFLEDDNNKNKKSFKRIIIKKKESDNQEKKTDFICKNNNNIIRSRKNIMSKFKNVD